MTEESVNNFLILQKLVQEEPEFGNYSDVIETILEILPAISTMKGRARMSLISSYMTNCRIILEILLRRIIGKTNSTLGGMIISMEEMIKDTMKFDVGFRGSLIDYSFLVNYISPLKKIAKINNTKFFLESCLFVAFHGNFAVHKKEESEKFSDKMMRYEPELNLELVHDISGILVAIFRRVEFVENPIKNYKKYVRAAIHEKLMEELDEL